MGTVAVTGIYKNEEKTLARALSSVFDFADAFYIGVDDSSTDDTLEIAKRWVQLKGKGKVIEFTWEDDFAKARNTVIDEIPEEYDWWFTIDGHEYIEPESQTLLPNIWEKLDQHPDVKAIMFSVQMGEEDSYREAVQIRMVKNSPEARYDRPLHNQIVGIHNGEKRTVAPIPDIVIHHDRSPRSMEERNEQRNKMVTKIFPEQLKEDPRDTQALFYLGCHYHAEGEPKKAVRYFKRYLRYSNNRYERGDVYHKLADCYNSLQDQKRREKICWEGLKEVWDFAPLWIHLGELAEREEKWHKALLFYKSASALAFPNTGIFIQKNFFTWIPWYKVLVMLERVGQVPLALQTAKKVLEFDDLPDQIRQEVTRAVNSWRYKIRKKIVKPRTKWGAKVPKIAITDKIGSFSKHLVRDWKNRGYEVEVRDRFDDSLGDWADVIWYEWCDDNLIRSQGVPWRAKSICRLHGYESFAGYPKDVNWKFVDRLVFVSDHHKEYTEREYDLSSTDVRVIHNGIDLDKFECHRNIEYEPGNNIAYVGFLNHKKGVDYLIEVASMLPDYNFHVAGEFQQPNIREFALSNKPKNLKFYGWVDDIPGFLEEMDYLISTSINESFGLGIAEAMARGIKPLVRQRPGVYDLWPEECIFSNIGEVKKLVREDYDPERYRNWVEERYNMKDQLDKINDLILELYEK